MRLSTLNLWMISFVFFCCTGQQTEKNDIVPTTVLTGPYFGLNASDTASIFAEGIISRRYQELNSVFSPDGNEFYFTLADPGRSFYTIMQYTKNPSGIWQGPEVASFSGHYGDADPYITSDGQKLYFISRRPIDPTSRESKDFDIWMVNRTSTGWSEAIRLPNSINTDQNEFYVSATDDGTIYYAARYDSGLGNGDIYEASLVDGNYVIQNAGPNINTAGGEGDPYVSPDGRMMIFLSSGREDDIGRGDLYISYKKDGKWQPSKNLGPRINSTQFEYCPMVSPDGKYFFWTSYRSSPFESVKGYDSNSFQDRIDNADNGLGNIFWIEAKILEEFK